MSLAIYLVLVLTVVAVMLSSYFLGEKSKSLGKHEPYEGGITGYGSTRIRFFTHYFLLAILFVLFDVESVFLYLWSVAVKEVGWLGFFQMFFFVGMLVLSLMYAIRLGVLDLVTPAKKVRQS